MPLVELAPRGSLLHRGEVAGDWTAAGEADLYELSLDAGQSFSVRLIPLEGNSDATLRVQGPGGVDILRDAGGTAEPEIIPLVPVNVAGQWTLTATADRSGSYRLELLLNGAWENEDIGAGGNNSPATAENLDAAFTSLADGAIKRAAIVGDLDATTLPTLSENFESGPLGPAWTTYTSEAAGRLRVTNTSGAAAGSTRALILDRSTMGTDTLVEATWTVDLSGVTAATLRFHHAEFGDEDDPLAATFTGHALGDGVAISADGTNWYRLLDSPNQTDNQWVAYNYDLAAAAASAGIALGSNFRVKFQQTDNNSTPTDGRGYDEISITASGAVDVDWHRLTLTDGETATLALAGGASLDLYDAANNLVASGVRAGSVSTIDRYRDTTNNGPSTYYARVSGAAGAYQLAVLRGAALENETTPLLLSLGDSTDGRATAIGHVASAGPFAPGIEHVVHISIDGLRADTLQTLVQTRPNDVPNWLRLQTEGGYTYNARTDFTHTVTLPNHTSMLTGRPVMQPAGQPNTVHHGWVINDNGSIAPEDTLHNVGNPNVDYMASAFDVTHDHGLSTALYTGKDKFIIYDQTYNTTTGAPDLVGDDNGPDKIDVYVLDDTAAIADVLVNGDGEAFAGFAADLAESDYGYSFVHLRDPDTRGHGSGWGTPTYINSLIDIDRYLGSIFAVIDTDPELAGKTAIILSTDHGGGVPLTSHTVEDAPLNYTIPMFIWGAGLPAGSDLYNDFAGQRFDPGTGRPDYNAVERPLRNGETGNIALAILGLPSIPGSTITAPVADARDDYQISVAAGETLTIETSTPADGGGEFVNAIDPRVELIDPQDMSIASDDNSAPDGRNARLTQTISIGGTYTVRVTATAGSGTYVLSLQSTPLTADLNNDRRVNLVDLAILQGNYGRTGDDLAGDINHSGNVDVEDLALFIQQFGHEAPAPSSTAPAAPAAAEPQVAKATLRKLRSRSALVSVQSTTEADIVIRAKRLGRHRDHD